MSILSKIYGICILLVFFQAQLGYSQQQNRQDIRPYNDLLQDILDAHVIMSEKKIDLAVQKLVDGMRANLPEELIDSVYFASQDMRIHNRIYAIYKLFAEQLPPSNEKAKARDDTEKTMKLFDRNKSIIKKAQSVRTQLLLDAKPIIRLALNSILKDCDSIKAKSNIQLKRTQNALKEPNTELKPISEISNMQGVQLSAGESKQLDEDKTLTQAEKETMKAYFKEEYIANRLVVAEVFAKEFDTDEKAVELAEELILDEANIAKYAYEKRKKKVSEKILLEDIKEVLNKKIDKILVEKFYKK